MRVYISTIVWGASYVRNFLEYSLPTMLSDGNLPALPDLDQVKYMIGTTPNDEVQMRASEVFRKLESIIDVEVFHIDHHFSRNKYQTVSRCQSECINRSRDADVIFFAYPDFVWGDGSLRNAATTMAQGHDGFFCQVPMLREENIDNVYAEIEAHQADGVDDPLRQRTKLTVSCRELVRRVIEDPNPLMTAYRVDGGYFTSWPVCIYWTVPEQGWLMRGFHIHPVALRVQHENPYFFFPFDISLDEEFAASILPTGARVYVPTDSDEFAVCSLREDSDSHPLMPGGPNVDFIARDAEFFAAPLHRDIALRNYRWHPGDIDEAAWVPATEAAEALIGEVLERLKLGDSELIARDVKAFNYRVDQRRRRAKWDRNTIGLRGFNWRKFLDENAPDDAPVETFSLRAAWRRFVTG